MTAARKARTVKDPRVYERRAAGAGSVDQLPSGRWRVRLSLVDGRRVPLGPFKTEQEAQDVLDAALHKIADAGVASIGGITLGALGNGVLAERELSGDYEAIGDEWSRFRNHIERSELGDRLVAAIGPVDVARLVAQVKKKLVATPHRGARPPKTVSRKTVREVLQVLRIILDAAVARGLIAANPARGIKVKRERRTHDPWTYLPPEEQARLLELESIPEEDRVTIAFGMGTLLRPGEQFHNYLRDLVVDGPDPHLWVRFGSKKGPPKNGKIRKIPLFGLGLRAARRWLELLPSYCPRNPLGLIFPGRKGGRRSKGKHLHGSRTITLATGKRKAIKVDLFQEHLALAGIVAQHRHDARPVRWYDATRHTGASSLVSGWWGRRWSLEEIKELMGHADISMTQRYAHLGESAVSAAAKQTSGGGGGSWSKVTRRSREGEEPTPVEPDSPIISRSGSTGTRTLDLRVKSPCPSSASSERSELHDHRVTSAGGGLRETAIAFLQGIRSPQAGELAAELWRAVLEGAAGLPADWVQRALELRDGKAPALWAAHSVTLAGLVLEGTLNTEVRAS